MATATLLDTAQLGPALALQLAASGQAPSQARIYDTGVTESVTAVALTSKSLGAGRWCIVGLAIDQASANTLTSYISASSASTTNIAPVKQIGTGEGNASSVQITSCVVNLITTTTVYLNAASSAASGQTMFGGLIAVQVG